MDVAEGSKMPDLKRISSVAVYVTFCWIRSQRLGYNHKCNSRRNKKLYEETFYENNYGTVGVVKKDVSDETLKSLK
jgi:hypothetical protein